MRAVIGFAKAGSVNVSCGAKPLRDRCGAPGAGHVRLNFATPRPVLTAIVDRMADAVRRR